MKYHLIICPFYLIQMLWDRAQLFLTNPRIIIIIINFYYYFYYYYSTYHFGKGPPRILSRHSRKQRSRGYYYTLHWYKASQYIRQYLKAKIHRGPYMSAHILLNLLNELEKGIKYVACQAFYRFLQRAL